MQKRSPKRLCVTVYSADRQCRITNGRERMEYLSEEEIRKLIKGREKAYIQGDLYQKFMDFEEDTKRKLLYQRILNLYKIYFLVYKCL